MTNAAPDSIEEDARLCVARMRPGLQQIIDQRFSGELPVRYDDGFRRDVANRSPEFFTGLLEDPDLPIAPAANRKVPEQKLRYHVLGIIWHSDGVVTAGCT